MRVRLDPPGVSGGLLCAEGSSSGDALLVIEVSDSSVRHNRGHKLKVCARHRVREVWIVDLSTDTLVVFRDADSGGYQQQLTLQPEEAVAPLAFPDLQLSVTGLLNLDHDIA